MSYKESHKGKFFASNYDVTISSKFETRIYQIENTIFTSILNDKIKGNINKSILDFACGTGRITSLIYKHHKNVVGVDISDDMLNVARNKYNDIKFITHDIINEEFKDKFDIITSFRFFLNAEYDLKKAVLLNLSKLLNKDGTIIFNIHMNKYSFAYFLSSIKYLLGLTKIKQNRMSYSEVKSLVNETGFYIEKSIGYSFFLGNPLLTFLPFNFLVFFDKILSKMKLLSFFSKDIIYVIKKIDEK